MSTVGIIWRASTSAYCLFYILCLCRSRLVCVETPPEENNPCPTQALFNPNTHTHTPRVSLGKYEQEVEDAAGEGHVCWTLVLYVWLLPRAERFPSYRNTRWSRWSRSESSWEMFRSDFTAVLHVKSLQCTDSHGLLLYICCTRTFFRVRVTVIQSQKNILPRLNVVVFLN